MPDILIRGMEMPEGCLSCNLRATSGLDEWMCMVNRMRFPSWEDGWNGDKYRHVDCPLVELPPHGDLIDADVLKAKAEYDRKHLEITGYERELLWHYLDVSMAPVIVPASEEVE